MVKLGSIDLGSNSTRILIAEVSQDKFDIIERKHIVTKMSEDLESTGEISINATKRVFSALRSFKKLLFKHEVENISVIGTAAIRDAGNSGIFIENIKKKFGFDVEVLSGYEEGITTSIGVLHFMQNLKNFLIVDIGGRSTEFIYDVKNKINCMSINLGVVTLTEKYFSDLPSNKDLLNKANLEITKELSNLPIPSNTKLIGVSGTALSLASIYKKQHKFNEDELHNLELEIQNIQEINHQLLEMTESEILTKFQGIDPKRAGSITSGVFLLEKIISQYNNSSIIISKNDILEGLILKKY